MTKPDEQGPRPAAEEIKPRIKSVWLLVSNICEVGKFKVQLEVNGKIYRDIFHSYVEQSEGVVSQSDNLTWIIENSESYLTLLNENKQLKAELEKVKK